MFRQFSRINVLLQLIVVLFVAMALSLPVFLIPFPALATRDAHPLFVFICRFLGDEPLVKEALAIGIVLFLAFFLYALSISHDMHPKESLLPVLFYYLLAAGFTEALSFGPALFASLFLMMSLFLILRIYGYNQPYKQVFSASFCVAIAALFYPPAACFMFFIWLSFLTYRIASWREWIISIIGAIVPYMYLITYYYWVGSLPEIVSNYNELFGNLMTGFPAFRLWQEIFLGFSGLALIMALFRQLILIQEKLISIRRKTWIFIDFIIVAALSGLLAGNDLPGHFIIIAIPGALFLSNSVTGKKASLLYELMAVLMVLLLVIARLSA
jgi:hypothetical protein